METQFNTGLVFAGYGENDIFPKMQVLNVDGGLFDKARFYVESVHDVTSQAATITAFAQDDTVNAFINGADERFRVFTYGIFIQFVSRLADEILRSHTPYSAPERTVATS